MIRSELYEAAKALDKAAPWRYISEGDLYAVAFPDGAIGYCCVSGQGNETPSLRLYLSDAALQSMLSMRLIPEDAPPHDHFEAMYAQDNLGLYFVLPDAVESRDHEDIADYGLLPVSGGRYPVFRRDVPRKQRWYLQDSREQNRMLIALQATLMLCRRLIEIPQDPDHPQRALREGLAGLGFRADHMPLLTWRGPLLMDVSGIPFPEDVAATQEIFTIESDSLVSELRRLPMLPGQTWTLDRVLIPTPMDGQPPVFPTVFLILDDELQALEMTLVRDYEADATEILEKLLTLFSDRGRPQLLRVQDREALLLVRGMAKQIGLPVLQGAVQGLPALREDLVDVMVARFMPPKQ